MVGEKGPEAIIPLDKMPSIFNRPIEVTVINQMDGMTVARVVQRHWSRSLSHAGLGVG
jgi:phage-related protein